MSELHLIVKPEAYELRLDNDVLTQLDGGAAALLPAAGERLTLLDIETAIEHAEDWLMPYSKSFQGMQLQVHDETGRLRSKLRGQASWTLEQAEQAFNRIHDAVAHDRATDREGVADVVLLREIAHHGRLSGIVFFDADPQPHIQ